MVRWEFFCSGKTTEVMIDLLRSAQTAGISARYVLFDSWFSSPKAFLTIKNDLQLDTIAMIKKSSKVKYVYNGELLNIKQIYSRNRKRRERSKYALRLLLLLKINMIPVHHIGMLCLLTNSSGIIRCFQYIFYLYQPNCRKICFCTLFL